jgi:hypothetical protein
MIAVVPGKQPPRDQAAGDEHQQDQDPRPQERRARSRRRRRRRRGDLLFDGGPALVSASTERREGRRRNGDANLIAVLSPSGATSNLAPKPKPAVQEILPIRARCPNRRHLYCAQQALLRR